MNTRFLRHSETNHNLFTVLTENLQKDRGKIMYKCRKVGKRLESIWVREWVEIGRIDGPQLFVKLGAAQTDRVSE